MMLSIVAGKKSVESKGIQGQTVARLLRLVVTNFVHKINCIKQA
jgi:hypothetical protein